MQDARKEPQQRRRLHLVQHPVCAVQEVAAAVADEDQGVAAESTFGAGARPVLLLAGS